MIISSWPCIVIGHTFIVIDWLAINNFQLGANNYILGWRGNLMNRTKKTLKKHIVTIDYKKKHEENVFVVLVKVNNVVRSKRLLLVKLPFWKKIRKQGKKTQITKDFWRGTCHLWVTIVLETTLCPWEWSCF
jgi:hypothetical protein